jgi:hypothetical protein
VLLAPLPYLQRDLALQVMQRAMQSIAQRIEGYPGFLTPLKEATCRYLKYPSEFGEGGVINIGHRPWVAELNYMFVLYPGIKRDILDRYCQRFQILVPEMYADFLREANGAFCFGMSFCGVPPSMLGNPPLLDRSVLQCHDLATAVTRWIDEYRVPAGFFRFGGRHYSYRENVAYFIDEGKRIVSVRGKKKVIGEWTSFSTFLSDELRASEKLEEELHPSQWNV